jgi:hypothetical protein
MATNSSPQNPCKCGCGTLVRNQFAQGHDGRLKGQLLTASRSADWWTREAAVVAMVEQGWGHFVDSETLATTPVRGRSGGRFVQSIHIDAVRFGWIEDGAGDSHAHRQCPSIQGQATWTKDMTGWACNTCIHTADYSELVSSARKAA